jgi:hypothetical protein
MPGIGTIVNGAAIVAGGLLGLFLGKFLKQRVQDTLMAANGVAVIILGLQGALVDADSIMLIISLALGALIGELLNLEGLLERFGDWLKRISHSEGQAGFTSAFVNASLTVCIGAMAIMGSIQDGLFHDPSILYAKAILDFIIIFVMASAQGKGAVFSAIPVVLVQGTMTLLALWISPIFTDTVLFNIKTVGSVLIFCVGINLLFGKKISTANLLPALVIAALWP